MVSAIQIQDLRNAIKKKFFSGPPSLMVRACGPQSKSRRNGKGPPMRIVNDNVVDFPAFFFRGGTKTEMRRAVAEFGQTWLELQHKRGAAGAVMVDIDDTLIDGNERVANGFEQMRDMYRATSKLFPLHVVTARPRSEHDKVVELLHKLDMPIAPDRLHMLPTRHYGGPTSHVEDFKWATFRKIADAHRGVVARFGDKMWDIAHLRALDRDAYRGDQAHVQDGDSYVFLDPRLQGTLSLKLPGMR